MEQVIRKIEASTLNEWINASTWVWPTLEILHFLGLSLLIGAMLIVDLRLIGRLRGIPMTAVHALAPWALGGFVLNAVSGAMFFVGDPGRYSVNVGFQVKLILIGVAGLNALWFFRAIEPKLGFLTEHGDTFPKAKFAAAISLGAWFGVLLLGRLIPYIGTG